MAAFPEAVPIDTPLWLKVDLGRAQIAANRWSINLSLYQAETTDALLNAKASGEVKCIDRGDQHTGGKFVLMAWSANKDAKLPE